MIFSAIVTNYTVASAQKTNSDNIRPNGFETKIWQKFLEVSLLPTEQQRREFFIKASAEDKSDMLKLHQAMFLVKRSDLTKEQKEIILEGIAMTTSELYDISKDRNQSQ